MKITFSKTVTHVVVYYHIRVWPCLLACNVVVKKLCRLIEICVSAENNTWIS